MKNPLTNKITSLLVSSIVLTVITIGSVLVWTSSENNRTAAINSQVMIEGGLQSLKNSLQRIAVDYSWWQDAVDNVRDDNAEWIYSNMGSGVTESGTMDLLVISQPSGKSKYGWIKGQKNNAPIANILSLAQIKMMHGRLKDAQIEDSVSEAQFAMVGDQLFLLTASYIRPSNVDDIDLDKLSINISGFLMDEDKIATLGSSYLADTLKMSQTIEPGNLHIALIGAGGVVLGNLTWTAPTPGTQSLRRSLLPVSAALGVFCIFGFLAAIGARKSADELARNEAEAFQISRTDSLTQLPNRLHLLEHLDQPAIRDAGEKGHLAVIFIDLDGFKYVNDTIGHAGGDELICQMAERLAGAIPKNAFLARVGGDEFNIIVSAKDIASVAKMTALNCLEEIKSDLSVHEKTFSMTASIGYALAEGVDVGCVEIVRRADVAMYEAKNTKAGDPVMYREDYESNTVKNKNIEEALRAALSNDEIRVNYQPIVNAKSGKMELVEALVRWNSKEFGPVSPMIFVPVAEEAGLIGILGNYVFRKVCEDMVKWPDLKVSINLSPVQLRDPRLVDTFLGIIEETGAVAKNIELELTEGVVVSHPKIAHEKLTKLKAVGFSISLDDFGTGFSSIGYLRQLPFDKLKIDRSFIMDVENSVESLNLMQAVAALGRAIDLFVVAEGVETAEQASLVRLAGCTQLQGYFYSKPLSLADLEQWHRAQMNMEGDSVDVRTA